MLLVRLRRAWCYLFHWREQVPYNGFGWVGWRCARCGWMFFSDWDDDGKQMLQQFRDDK